MKDPRYPNVKLNTDPEFETDKERADYWERLAKEYAAKLNALRCVLDGDYKLIQGEDGNFYSVPVFKSEE